tara:strand:- start:7564 stop:7752 length:189 start_codon:yes stop_codon:yes gene_type:complete
MILKYLELQQNKVDYLCTVCITDNNGGKIALTIIISTLVILGVGNWAWKKYLSKKKEISQEK